jgi:hypothetical protein
VEREFLLEYVHDKDEGGFYYWVEQDGNAKDTKKYSLFQANIILWFGGLESQHPDPVNIEMIKSAADYLVKNLYKGNGEWYEYDSRNHRTKQEFFWNPRSETYIAFGLLEAYRLTKTEKYLQAALETTNAQRLKAPDAKIMADHDPTEEIGFRFPEHMGHMEEYRLTGNTEALEYARMLDERYRGRFARESLGEGDQNYYIHGTALIDQFLYALLDKNAAAYADASRSRSTYWNAPHDDEKPFNANIPGESADHGRDYYDKRAAMNLLEWTIGGEQILGSVAAFWVHDQWQRNTQNVFYYWDHPIPHGFNGTGYCFGYIRTKATF